MLTSRLATTTSERTARVAVDAAEHGDRERPISALSWFGTRVQGLAPDLLTWTMTLLERWQPHPGAPGEKSKMRLGSEVVAASRDARVRALASAARADEQQHLPAPS